MRRLESREIRIGERMYLTLDSSVVVASIKEDEKKHEACKKLMEKVKDGEFLAFEPYIVLIEVVAAIKRRTDSKELAERVKKNLEEIETIFFFELVKSRAEKAIDIATQTGVRGMDAIVIQIVKETDSRLVDLDKEMIEKAKQVVRVMDIDELLVEES